MLTPPQESESRECFGFSVHIEVNSVLHSPVLMKNFEILQELPKGDTETRGEHMPLGETALLD